MLKTCTLLSNVPFFLTAVRMPRGMVMPKARMVLKIFMKMVMDIGSEMTSLTGFL